MHSKYLLILCLLVCVSCKVSQIPSETGGGGGRPPPGDGGGLKIQKPTALIPSYAGQLKVLNQVGGNQMKAIDGVRRDFGFLIRVGTHLKIEKVLMQSQNCEGSSPVPLVQFYLEQGSRVLMPFRDEVPFDKAQDGMISALIFNEGDCDSLNVKFAVQVIDKEAEAAPSCWNLQLESKRNAGENSNAGAAAYWIGELEPCSKGDVSNRE